LDVVKLTFVPIRESDGVFVEGRHIGTTVPADLDLNYSPFAIAVSRCDETGDAHCLAKSETTHLSPLYPIGFNGTHHCIHVSKAKTFEASDVSSQRQQLVQLRWGERDGQRAGCRESQSQPEGR